MNGKTFRPDRHQLLFEIFLLRHMQRKIEFPARTTDIKRLFRHLFCRDNHIFRGHSLRRMGSHHPAVFQPPEILRKPDRGQFPPVGIQQKIFVPAARCNRQTAVVDLVFRCPQIHCKTDNIALPDRQGNSVPRINTVADYRRLHRFAVAQNELAIFHFQDLRHLARFGDVSDFRIEENLHADLIIFDVAELWLRPAPGTERFHRIDLIVHDPSGGFHFLPDHIRQKITLPVGRRNRDAVQRASAVVGQLHKILCGAFQISSLVLVNVTMLIQMLETIQSASRRDQLNPFPVFLHLLTVNLRKTGLRDVGMILQQTEEIACFHRGMLTLVADKQHPVFVLHRKFHHLRSLPERVQTGFVNDQIRAFRRQLVLVL